jgi:hypothetical protein
MSGKAYSSSAFRRRCVRPNRPRCHLGGTQVFGDCPSFTVGRLTVILGMDSLEHMAHFANPGRRHVAEDVPVEINNGVVESLRRLIPFSSMIRVNGGGICSGGRSGISWNSSSPVRSGSSFRADDDRPGIDPGVAVSLMLAGLLTGIVMIAGCARPRSASRFAGSLATDCHEALPHHSSLTRIRQLG